MTRLLLVFLATLGTSYADIIFDAPEISQDPLQIDRNTHPKDTLRYYLNNLTNYIYDAAVYADADPRAAFFSQKHQLRIYDTLNRYIEENYGSTLREILSNEYHTESKTKEQTKSSFIAMIIDIEEKVAEMFLKVIYGSGDKPVEQERLQEYQEKRRNLVKIYAKFATGDRLVNTYLQLAHIHERVLDNFNNTAYGDTARPKRAPLDDEKIQKQLNDYLRKLTANAYGVTEIEFLSAKIDITIQPPGSLISLKRFIEANYREVLEQDIEARDGDKQQKIIEMEEIKQIEEKTTALWFEAINYANLDLLKNQTIVDDINAAIVARLDEYMQFRTLEEIKETNRRIHEVYGHLFKDCDQSTYLILSKVFKDLRFDEYYGKDINETTPEKQKNIEKLIKYSEAMWQTNHGMSANEKRRVRSLLESINSEGVEFLLTIYEVTFWKFTDEARYQFDPKFFNYTEFDLQYEHTQQEFGKTLERYDLENDKNLRRVFFDTLGFSTPLVKLYIAKNPNRFNETEKAELFHKNTFEELEKREEQRKQR